MVGGGGGKDDCILSMYTLAEKGFLIREEKQDLPLTYVLKN